MESVFGSYARYYDLLYQDKNYVGESEYIDKLIRKHSAESGSILELGCGTGKHAAILSSKGYCVHGVDFSEEMLEKAKDRLGNRSAGQVGSLNFSRGDLCHIRLKERFDTVIALFHVMSYQNSNEALQQSIATAKEHIDPNGLFIFDVWYGPAVLSVRPAVRIKRLEDDDTQITRIAEPVLRSNCNIVDVYYHVFIKDKKSGIVSEIKEKHSMRYLFEPEIEMLLSSNGFELIHCEEWLSGKSPGEDTWGVCFIAKPVGKR